MADLRDFLREDPDRVRACSERIRVIKVNRRTLSLFEANDVAHLVENLGRVFRDDMFHAFVDELVLNIRRYRCGLRISAASGG